MDNNFSSAMLKRRSIYALSDKLDIDDKKIVSLVEFALKHSPTAYNSQGGRAVVLFNDDNKKLWDIVLQTLLKLPATDKEATTQKINSFAQSMGTVMFFNDTAATKALSDRFPLYSDTFQVWALQSGGMLQFAVWTLLAEEGIGASLQHYNPLIDDAVKQAWGLPQEWQLLAQMPFGRVMQPAGSDKEFEPAEKTLKVFGN